MRGAPRGGAIAETSILATPDGIRPGSLSERRPSLPPSLPVPEEAEGAAINIPRFIYLHYFCHANLRGTMRRDGGRPISAALPPARAPSI